MALSNFADLKASVASWLNRTDLASVIPDFVRLAEAEIRRDVEARAMQNFATGSLSGGIVATPADYVKAKRLLVAGKKVDYVTPERYQDLESSGYSDIKYFTQIGLSLYVLNGGDSSYSLLYWAKFAAFSSDAETNWLLSNAPDVYLWKSCEKGAVFLRDVEAVTGFKALYDEAVEDLNTSEREAEYSGSTLEIRPNNVAA